MDSRVIAEFYLTNLPVDLYEHYGILHLPISAVVYQKITSIWALVRMARHSLYPLAVWHILCKAILGVIADFTCLVLPMPLIWQMSLPRKDRTSIVFLLGLGIIACGAGLVRTVLQQASSRTQGSPHLDVTWATWPFFLAVEIEINVGIVINHLLLRMSGWR